MQPVDAASRDRREVVETPRVLLVGAEGVLQRASYGFRAQRPRATASSRLRIHCALRERRKREQGYEFHATTWMVLRGYFAAPRSLQVLESL